MNIYDISEKAGVSIATVSRVLNGNSKVSDKTRQKILKVMEETGYQPNVFARGLGLNTMNTVGVLCADSSDLVLASSVYHIEQQLYKYHYNALLSCTGYQHENRVAYLNLLLSKRVDALILAGSNFVEEDPMKNQYIIDAAKEIPVMIINGYLDAPNVYCLVSDDRNLMCRLTQTFLKKSKKVLYLYRSLSYSARQKLHGVEEAYMKEGMKLSKENQLRISGTIGEVRKALEEKWNEGESWDVILTSDDELAVGAYKFASTAKIPVPESLQIVGYNNSRISICCEPELSSVDNHLDDASKTCVDLLMKILNGESVPNKTVIPGNVIIRGTTVDILDVDAVQ